MLDRYNFKCFRPTAKLNVAESRPVETMRHKTTKALFDYWDQLRANRLAPARTDVEPADIAALLPHTFVLEQTARNDARFRLAGEAVSDLIGMELTGMGVAAIWDDASRPRISQLVEGVISAPATAVVMGGKQSNGDIQGVKAEFCFLPLRTEGGPVNRIIGTAVALEGDAVWRGGDPRRLHLSGMRLSAIHSEIEETAGPSVYAQPSEIEYPSAAESAAPFELKSIDGELANEVCATTPERKRPHLRVVSDDE